MIAPVLDPSVFAELSDTMGEDFARELVTTFLDETPQMLATLTDAAARGDGDGFRRAAHSLKSNAEVFGAGRLADLARGLELGGLPDGSSPLQELQQTVAVTCDALGQLIHE